MAYKLTSNRNTVLIKAYLDEHVDRVVTGEMVQQYYNENRDKYTTTRVKGAHILFSLNGLTPEQREEKLILATQITERARNGEAFEKLVKEFSDDKKTVEQGGEVEWMSNKDRVGNGQLLNSLLKLSAGGISEPIETKSGLHILKTTEGPVVEEVGFESVKDKIEYQLKYEERTKELQRLKRESKEKFESDLAALGIENN